MNSFIVTWAYWFSSFCGITGLLLLLIGAAMGNTVLVNSGTFFGILGAFLLSSLNAIAIASRR